MLIYKDETTAAVLEIKISLSINHIKYTAAIV